MRINSSPYYTSHYGVALFKLLSDGTEKLISRRTLWGLYDIFEKASKEILCFSSFTDCYSPSYFCSTEEYKEDLSEYVEGFEVLLKTYPKDNEKYYDLEYLKWIFTQANLMDYMCLQVRPEPVDNDYFEPRKLTHFSYWEDPKKVFTYPFPTGIVFSFLFGKLTIHEFINEFKKLYQQDKTETNKNPFIEYTFTDNELIFSMFSTIKNFNQNTENTEILKTRIGQLNGQTKNYYTLGRTDYFKLLIHFTFSNTQWKLQVPANGIWNRGHTRSWLVPFRLHNINSLPGDNFTWILGSLKLSSNEKLAVWVNFLHAVEMKKTVYEVEDCIKEYVYQTNSNNHEESVIILALNKTDVFFANNQIYFIQGNQKIYGQEISSADLNNSNLLPQAIYHLDNEETIVAKNIHLNLEQHSIAVDSDSFLYFYFKFPLGSKDYDDTDFVVEGLSFNGEPLPPLKVHLNYVEAEDPYEKTTIKEVPPDYFYEHGLALYKTDSEGEKELITKKLFHNYAKYIGKATETLSGFREYFNYYKPITIEITKNNHSVLNALLKETEILAKKHIEHAEFSAEISELYSFLILANSLESCFIYDSPDPYNDKLFLPNKIDSSYIFDIRPLEKLIAHFLEKKAINYDPTEPMTTDLFVKEYKKQYILEEEILSNSYNYQDRKVLSDVYSWINLYPKTYCEKQLRAEIGKLFGLFSKIHYVKDDYAKPAVQLTQTGTDWEFFTPFTDRWNYRFNRMLLPTYFFNRGAEALPGYHFYWYFATIHLEENKKLAVMLQFNDLPEKRKVVFDRPTVYEEYEYIKEGSTYHETTVTLSFTNQEVDFDNSKVYFLVNGEKKMGKEVNTVFLQEENCTELGEHIYTLNSHEVLLNNKVCLKLDEEYISPEAKKNPEIEYEPYRETAPFVFSSYFFKFPITCEEYENAEFVLDGLSYKGQALPSLKVRINYVKDYELS